MADSKYKHLAALPLVAALAALVTYFASHTDVPIKGSRPLSGATGTKSMIMVDGKSRRDSIKDFPAVATHTFSFFDALSKYVLIPAAVLYFVGWVYLYTLLVPFDVDTSILNADIYSTMMYSVSVPLFAFTARYYLVAFGVIVVILVFAIEPARRFSRTLFGQLLLYFLFLAGCYYLAQDAGKSRAQQIMAKSNPQVMHIQFSREFPDPQNPANCFEWKGCFYDAIAIANSSGDLREVLETKDDLVVFDVVRGYSYAVPRKLVDFTQSQ